MKVQFSPKSIKGFGWILRPYKNKLGIYSLVLIFLTFIAFWFSALLSYQYKRLYFDELKGIYPPMFINARTQVNWSSVQQNIQGIKAVRKERFEPNASICIDNNNGMGLRPVPTGIRTLHTDTINEQLALYINDTTAGVWLSSELYEVIFGHPPTDETTQKTITLIAKLDDSKDEFVDSITCETDAATVELPIIRVIHLQNHARWMVLRENELPKLNIDMQLPRISSIYTEHSSSSEYDIYLQLHKLEALKGRLLYWMFQLPLDLQLNLQKLEAYFKGFFFLVLAVASAYLINLYLLTQKKLQQGFYLLRFFAVDRIQFFTRVLITIIGFWSFVLITSFLLAIGLLKIFYTRLSTEFNVWQYLKQLDGPTLGFIAFVLIMIPFIYVYFHFIVTNFNQKWKGVQQ